ncbi:MAG: hypothetical protein ACOYJD_04445, partial [Christensenellales bacterium]
MDAGSEHYTILPSYFVHSKSRMVQCSLSRRTLYVRLRREVIIPKSGGTADSGAQRRLSQSERLYGSMLSQRS